MMTSMVVRAGAAAVGRRVVLVLPAVRSVGRDRSGVGGRGVLAG